MCIFGEAVFLSTVMKVVVLETFNSVAGSAEVSGAVPSVSDLRIVA